MAKTKLRAFGRWLAKYGAQELTAGEANSVALRTGSAAKRQRKRKYASLEKRVWEYVDTHTVTADGAKRRGEHVRMGEGTPDVVRAAKPPTASQIPGLQESVKVWALEYGYKDFKGSSGWLRDVLRRKDHKHQPLEHEYTLKEWFDLCTQYTTAKATDKKLTHKEFFRTKGMPQSKLRAFGRWLAKHSKEGALAPSVAGLINPRTGLAAKRHRKRKFEDLEDKVCSYVRKEETGTLLGHGNVSSLLCRLLCAHSNSHYLPVLLQTARVWVWVWVRECVRSTAPLIPVVWVMTGAHAAIMAHCAGVVQADGAGISFAHLRDKVQEWAEESGHVDFKCSSSWLRDTLKRVSNEIKQN